MVLFVSLDFSRHFF